MLAGIQKHRVRLIDHWFQRQYRLIDRLVEMQQQYIRLLGQFEVNISQLPKALAYLPHSLTAQFPMQTSYLHAWNWDFVVQ